MVLLYFATYLSTRKTIKTMSITRNGNRDEGDDWEPKQNPVEPLNGFIVPVSKKRLYTNLGLARAEQNVKDSMAGDALLICQEPDIYLIDPNLWY